MEPFLIPGAAVRGVKLVSAPRAAKCFELGHVLLCRLCSASFKGKIEFLLITPQLHSSEGAARALQEPPDCQGLGTASGWSRCPSAPLEMDAELQLPSGLPSCHLDRRSLSGRVERHHFMEQTSKKQILKISCLKCKKIVSLLILLQIFC